MTETYMASRITEVEEEGPDVTTLTLEESLILDRARQSKKCAYYSILSEDAPCKSQPEELAVM